MHLNCNGRTWPVHPRSRKASKTGASVLPTLTLGYSAICYWCDPTKYLYQKEPDLGRRTEAIQRILKRKGKGDLFLKSTDLTRGALPGSVYP